jgi:hypothetical protein
MLLLQELWREPVTGASSIQVQRLCAQCTNAPSAPARLRCSSWPC